MAKESRFAVTPRSGTVFADLGFAEPGEELAKAQLANLIGQVIKRRPLTQAAAAALMGVDQPKVSALLNGRIENLSSERAIDASAHRARSRHRHHRWVADRTTG